jgi:serine/threonine-protein kinase HipA
VNFFERVIFAFLTGNANMHLKNFSLIDQPGIGYNLAPAYSMMATTVVNPDDSEEMALNLNGKRKKIRRSDFTAMFNGLRLDSKQQRNLFAKFDKIIPVWLEFINISFLDNSTKEKYQSLIRQRHLQLSINF